MQRRDLPIIPYKYLLCGIIVFSYFSRLLHLGDQSLWGDEAFTYMVTQWDHWLTMVIQDVHPPLYFGFIRFWGAITGLSEFSLRYPSVLASIISTALIATLAQELTRHQPRHKRQVVALLAALLFALADLEIMVSQEARSYTLHLIPLLLSVLAYLRWSHTQAMLWAGVYVLSTASIIYIHYVGVFTAFALGLHVLLFLRGTQRWQAIGLSVVAALLFMPWALIALTQQVSTFSGFAVDAYASDWGTLLYFRDVWLSDQWPLLLGLALLGIVTSARRTLSGSVLLLFWVLIPLGLAFLGNLRLPLLYDYRLSQITPAIVLLIALGLANFERWSRVFLISIIAIHGIFTVDAYRPKPPWREFGTMVSQFAQEDQLVLLDFGGGDYTMQYYLDRTLPEAINVTSMWQWRRFEPDTYESGLLGTLDAYDTIWLARWHESAEVFFKLQATGHQTSYRYEFADIPQDFELYRFDRITTEPLAVFQNGMALQAVERATDAQRIDLLWTSTSSLAVDYTVSVKILDEAGEILAQQDRVLAPPTSTWNAADIVYDSYTLSRTEGDILIQLYQWTPQGIVPILSESNNDGVKIKM